MTPVAAFEFVLVLLVASLVLALLARRLHLPPAAAFIIGGAALALMPGVPEVAIDPALVLVLFLPPLLMSSAFFTVWREFRDNLTGILLLAVGAVIFTTLVVGVVVHWLVPALPWAVCFALGAVVSPPDAVAAEAVLERLHLPGRLVALLQGESLLNDAAGLVLFRFAVAAALTGAFSAGAAAATFAAASRSAACSSARPSASSFSFILRRIREVGSRDHGDAAGALGRLYRRRAARRVRRARHRHRGLILGWRQHEDMSAAVRLRARAFWGVMVFALEALVFILIGLSLRGVLLRLAQRGCGGARAGRRRGDRGGDPRALRLGLRRADAALRRLTEPPPHGEPRGGAGDELGRHARRGHARRRAVAARCGAGPRPGARRVPSA